MTNYHLEFDSSLRGKKLTSEVIAKELTALGVRQGTWKWNTSNGMMICSEKHSNMQKISPEDSENPSQTLLWNKEKYQTQFFPSSLFFHIVVPVVRHILCHTGERVIW
jgi:hypothetical protein